MNNDGTWKPHVIEKMPDYIYGVLNLDIIGGPGTHWVAVIQMPNGAGGSMTIFMDPLTSKGTEQLKDSPGLLNFKKKADVVLKGVLQTEKIKEFEEVDEAISNYRKTDYTKKSNDATQSTLGYGNEKEIYGKVEDVYCGAYACGLIFGVLPHRIFQVSGAKRPQFVIYQKDIEDMFGIPWVRTYESRGGNTDREYKRIQEVNQQMEEVERALQPDLIIEKFYKFITMTR